jgi:thiosulfate/3-mercaptopyruvate sulfurtransferase
MQALFVFATTVALSVSSGAAVAPQSTTSLEPGPLVSTAWLQQHLADPRVRVIGTGDRDRFDRAHVPGARFLEHMDTLEGNHHLLPVDRLAAVLARAGAADGTRIVLYGDSPMTTGWVFMALASVGHGNDVSMLDGNIELWLSEKRPIATDTAPAATGRLTVKPASDISVDRSWVRGHLESPDVRVLDVRTKRERDAGHLPGATLVLWQDLFADQRTLKFKSIDELRALFTHAGVQPRQQVVTYCAVGMRASLMYWAARLVGVPARVYVGSYQDWQQDSANPIVR